MWQRSTSSSLAGAHSTNGKRSCSTAMRPCDSGWPPVGCRRANAWWLTTSTATACSAIRRASAVQPELERVRLGAGPVGRRRRRAAAAAPPRPSSRSAGRAGGRRRSARTARPRARPRASRTAPSIVAADFGPTPGRAGDPVGRVAAQRDEVRHLLGLDAVALAHLGGPDPRELAHALHRLEDVTRSLTSWNASRSEVVTTTGPAQPAAAAARKSSAS